MEGHSTHPTTMIATAETECAHVQPFHVKRGWVGVNFPFEKLKCVVQFEGS